MEKELVTLSRQQFDALIVALSTAEVALASAANMESLAGYNIMADGHRADSRMMASAVKAAVWPNHVISYR